MEELARARIATLADLATSLQQAWEEERGRLASQLHDELGSLLTTAKLDVARLNFCMAERTQELTERISHLSEALNKTIALKRQIIEDLRPSALFNLGLVAALEILTREVAARSGLIIASDLEMAELDPVAQLTAYRLVQESLIALCKHGAATKVTITMHHQAQHLLIEISDDADRNRLGRRHNIFQDFGAMQHRVESIGGVLNVVFSIGEGVCISVALPRSPARA